MATNGAVLSAVEAATERHGRLFIAYIAALVITGLAVALFTYLVWDSGNKVQEAVQADANVRIEEARAEAASANQRAAEANEKAEAERLARIKIEERLGGWRLDLEARTRLTEKLKQFANTPFDLCVNPQELRFMDTLDGVLIGAGWARQKPTARTVPPPGYMSVPHVLSGKAVIGYSSGGVIIELAQERAGDFRPAADALIQGLTAEGVPAFGRIRPQGTEPTPNVIHVVIGCRE